MSQEVYNTPLSVAIRTFTQKELVALFGRTHPAFLAAIMREASRFKR